LDEADETIEVTLSTPSNATLGSNTVHAYTIADDDVVITVTPDDDLRAIVESAPADSVISLTAGTFNLAPQAPFDQGILIQNKSGLTITGQGWDETTIKLTAADAKFGFYIGSNVSNLTIENLRIEGTYPPSVGNYAIGNYSGTTNVSNVTFRNLQIEDFASGIDVNTGLGGAYDGVTITGCHVVNAYGEDAGWGYGIHLGNVTNALVSNNLIQDGTRHSIYISRAAANSNVTISGNYIVDHHFDLGHKDRWYTAALVCSRASDVRIVDNILVNTRTIGISIEPDEIEGWPTEDIVLLNNQVIAEHYVGIWAITDDLPNTHAALGNSVVLHPSPEHPAWCTEFSHINYPVGVDTDSDIEVPNARWDNAEYNFDYTTKLGDYAYVMAGGVLDKIAAYTWDYTTCPTTWPNAAGMTALEDAAGPAEGRLYIADNTGLYEVDPDTWNVNFKAGDWSGTQFMTASDGYVYILKDDVLHRLTPGSLDSVQHPANWSNALWMWDWGGDVYIYKNEDSHVVDLSAFYVAPTLTVDLRSASDTGHFSYDNITNDDTPTYDVTVNQAGTIDIDWDDDGSVDVTDAVGGAGTYQYTPASALSDGVYLVAVTFTAPPDVATASDPTTIDTQGPLVVWVYPPGPVDTHVSQIQVEYFDSNGMWVATATDAGNYELLASGGDGSFGEPNDVDLSGRFGAITYNPQTDTATIPIGPALTDEVYQLTVTGEQTVRDAAGNALNNGAFDTVRTFSVDASPATVTVDLKPESDTGVSSTDNVTSDTRPVYQVTINREGTIDIDWDGDTFIDVTDYKEGAGTFEYTPDFDLSDGLYPVNVTFIDIFENSVTDSDPTTIDTTRPATPGAPDLQAASDTGVSQIDNITKDNTPTFDVGAGPYFRMYRDGVQISGDDESGSTYTAATQADGTYDYTTASMDAAGNVSSQSDALEATIDTTGPNVSSVTPWGTVTERVSRSVVSFAEANAMWEATVTDPANYVLLSSGGDATFGDGNEADLSHRITGIDYDEGTKTATLTLVPALGVEDYQLTILGTATVRDSAGNALNDGSEDEVVTFSVDNAFGDREDVDAGDGPRSVVSADFDQDGLADLAMVNTAANSVTVLYGQPDGGFGGRRDYAVGESPRDIVTADFDGNGRLDLAVTNFSDNDVSLLWGLPGGAFGSRQDKPVGAGPTGIVSGDFNGDGRPDLATANYNDDTVTVVYKGATGGYFTNRQDIAVGYRPSDLATDDFNGDDRLDLAVANFYDNDVSILWGLPGGAFGSRQDYPTGARPVAIVAGDFSGDGRVDIATANYSDNTASVLYKLELGGYFGLRLDVAVGRHPTGLAAGRFNEDARLDLAVTNYADSDVSVLWGLAGGGVGNRQDYGAGSRPIGITTRQSSGLWCRQPTDRDHHR